MSEAGRRVELEVRERTAEFPVGNGFSACRDRAQP